MSTDRSESPAEASRLIERGESGRPEIALTFDAGSGRGDAERILDILSVYGIVASFGVTGQWAEANPDLIRRIVGDGHLLINHTWSHSSWTGYSTASNLDDPATWKPLSRQERIDELRRTEEVIFAIAGYDITPYFRPAYGDYDQEMLEELGAAGYTVTVMWSCESLAWQGWSADEIITYCTTDMVPGDIILLHVSEEGTDSAALPGLIDGLTAQGFTFVTVDALLQP